MLDVYYLDEYHFFDCVESQAKSFTYDNVLSEIENRELGVTYEERYEYSYSNCKLAMQEKRGLIYTEKGNYEKLIGY